TVKNGQIHIDHYGGEAQLANFFARVKPKLLASIAPIEKNMKKRGGGLLDLQLKNSTAALEGHYQLHATFETKNAMGANFINSCLEQMAHTFETEAQHFEAFKKNKKMPRALMSILSNYVPECMVRAEVSCRTAHLKTERADGETFAKNFVRAVQIANTETRRAVTHNKGIMNGIDAVVIATGNDFRAVEAGAHAHACKNGRYTSLTKAEINDGVFRFWIELPLAVGTVGGLTGLHPLVRFSMQLLQGPTAEELMQYVAVAGLAQNFAAVRSLITTGIQKGHMKMHLMNILNQCNATHTEKEKAVSHFADRPVSQPAVKGYIRSIR
ncbi:MAG: hydroxymethylglutaryl-CoA reductase, partial [Marinirhabdus sp.]